MSTDSVRATKQRGFSLICWFCPHESNKANKIFIRVIIRQVDGGEAFPRVDTVIWL